MIHVSEPVRNVVANAMKERHMNDMTPAGTDLAVPEEKVLALIFADQAQADALFERVKAAAMSEALDLPVTRRMTTEQKTRFLDAMHAHWSAQGIILTMPPERRRDAA